jgi:prevent-host-death family protein
MARTVSMDAARKDLAELVNMVRYAGQSVVISRRGRPVAMLAPVNLPEVHPVVASAMGARPRVSAQND